MTVFITCHHAKYDVSLLSFGQESSVLIECKSTVSYVVVEFMNESRHQAVADWLVGVQELRMVEMGCAR